MHYDLANGMRQRAIEDVGEMMPILSGVQLSHDGVFMLIQARELPAGRDMLDSRAGRTNLVVYNLARNAERIAFDLPDGDLLSALSMGNLPLSKSGGALIVRAKDMIVYHNLARGGVRRDLVRPRSGGAFGPDMGAPPFVAADNGAAVAVQTDDDRLVYFDLAHPVWAGATAPRGRALRNAVCAASGESIRPFPSSLRDADASERTPSDQRLHETLRGRPWNPCDWRGVGAVLPNAKTGDGWFEGLRQWLRYVSIRAFGAADWTCTETTSAASAERRARRNDMCAGLSAPRTAIGGELTDAAE